MASEHWPTEWNKPDPSDLSFSMKVTVWKKPTQIAYRLVDVVNGYIAPFSYVVPLPSGAVFQSSNVCPTLENAELDITQQSK